MGTRHQRSAAQEEQWEDLKAMFGWWVAGVNVTGLTVWHYGRIFQDPSGVNVGGWLMLIGWAGVLVQVGRVVRERWHRRTARRAQSQVVK